MKASVLMSIYNETEKEIDEAVESVLQQTYKNFEFIIIHDNPASKTKEHVTNKLRQKDPRITVIQNLKNIGLAMSMNKAFEAAKGDYIIRMDADDICEPNRFEREIALLNTQNYDLVFSNYTYIDEEGNSLFNGRKAISSDKSEDLLLSDIIFEGLIHHPTIAMTRELFIKSKGYRDFPCSQDLDLWLRMIEQGGRLLFLTESLLKYRIRSNSITGSNRLKQHLTISYIIELFDMRLKKGTDDFSKEKYQEYIHCRLSENEKNSFAKGLAYLQRAQASDNVGTKCIYRIKAFCVSKPLRHSYLIKRRNKTRYLEKLESTGRGKVTII